MEKQQFIAQTPLGPMNMCNYIAKLNGQGAGVVVISGHYDTIRPESVLPTGRIARCWRLLSRLKGDCDGQPRQFLGANDGGSSAGLLLELACFLRHQKLQENIWIAMFDGEESLVEWHDNDHTYGSRHQAAHWQRDGTLPTIQALINLDMVGAKNLTLAAEGNSTRHLRHRIWQVAHRCGYASRFPNGPEKTVSDDHIPFIRAGVPAVDLIDAQYGPDNCFWHTLEDSPDKLSAHSFGMIAHVLLEVLRDMGVVQQP